MPRKTNARSLNERGNLALDMHSEDWWIRLMDNDLTAIEQVQWETHLQQCEPCRNDWEAFALVDEILLQAPTPPTLPSEFAAETVTKIIRKQKVRRLLMFLVGALVVVLVAALTFAIVGSAYSTLERSVGAVVSARQLLFQSFMETFVALVLTWRAALPFIIGGVVIAFFLMMPNSLLMTVALVWLKNQRRSSAAP